MFPINQNPIAAASAKEQYFLDSALKRCSFRPESPRNVRSSLSLHGFIFGYLDIKQSLVVLETQRTISF